MISKELTVINKLGLHARAAAKLVSVASRYGCDVQIAKSGRQVNGKSIMGVMMLAASQDSTVTITVDGEEETEAMEEIEKLFANRFDEEE
jgi:phosphotransferase system HPr (HPr) family protein